VHALLHIADAIVAAGPVWASWSFATERYCGKLQRAIHSRRYPFRNLDRFVLKDAALTHATLKFNLHGELSLRKAARDFSEHVAKCEAYLCHKRFVLNIQLDPSCLLSYPSLLPASSLDSGLLSKILSALVLRFKPNIQGMLTTSMIRAIISPDAREWRKLRILPAGDSINTAGSRLAEDQDGRDQTMVRVSPSSPE
jgi:hypothetical protein